MKVAVVLFNLGGPDSLKAVRPFLFNLFRDPAIIQLPTPARYALAALISTSRNKTAQANYAIMGGRSPILPQTEAQAAELEAEIQRRTGYDVRVFIAMRYWKPFAKETAKAVATFQPEHVVMLPLYPQYSTTTTGSSFADFRRVYRGSGELYEVCCYPDAENVAVSHADAIREVWEEAGKPDNVRLLFSAHGLPQQIVDAGDPYQRQVERTVAALRSRLADLNFDSEICYQSRVGPLKWIGPSTEACILRAAAQKRVIVVVPVAFVSEHSETLVELDIEYRHLAEANGAPGYVRAATVQTQPAFIAELAALARRAAAADTDAIEGAA